MTASQILLAVLIVGTGLACHRGEAPESKAAAVLHVATAPVTAQAFPQVINVIGTIVPRPGRFAALAPPAPTRVARIFVAQGQWVAPGDSLIEFERAPFDAGAKSAAAALVSAQHGYSRAVRLVQAGILPQKDSDQAAADLAQAEAAAVIARRSQQLATLRAPIGGVVTAMRAVLGAAADPTQTLVEVADPAALDLVFNVTPAEAAQIRPGDTLRVAASEGGEALGTGRITSVGAAVDTATRAVPVRARVPRPTRPLRIGESVAGWIVAAVHPHALVIPVAALVPQGEGYQVFVVDSAGVAHARPVTVGARTEILAEIVQGLALGEVIVTADAYGVEDGSTIERTPP